MEGIRERAAWASVIALSLLLIASLAGVVRGGPLDPTGPPGSTGKNVITSLPFTISQPGSYVLNGNLTCTACTSGQNGITVTASDVTIDLQGFELGGVVFSGDGIHGNAPNITVRDGTISDWFGAGFYAVSDATADDLRVISNTRGLDLGPRSSVSNCLADYTQGAWAVQVQERSSVAHCRIEEALGGGLRVYSDASVTDTTVVRTVGTGLLGDDRITIENCHLDGGGASATGSLGIQVGPGSVLSGCTVINHAAGEILTGARSVLENCVADGFGGPGNGIEMGDDSVIRGCTARNNGGVEILSGARSTLENCSADGAGTAGDGINVGAGSTIRGCTASNNGGNEILAGNQSTIEDCSATGNGTAGRGIWVGADAVIRNCVASNNGDVEIIADDGSLIEASVADGWTGSAAGPGDGIVVSNDSVVRGCNSRFNAGTGVRAQGQLNRIEGNRSYSNGIYGFTAEGGANVGMQNSAGFNSTGNYGINPNNQFVVVNGTAGQTNPFANVQ